MSKHAYLIMAHNNFEQLITEIKLLDDERNDLYLHIDKKAKGVDFKKIESSVKKSKVYFIKRIDVKWAGYSVVETEIELLKNATKRKYEYYHLLSGMDLPLNTQDEVHEFFEKNKGKEFVSFDNKQIRKDVLGRIRYYYFFQDIYGRNRKNIFCVMLYALEKGLIKVQKLFKVNRLKNEKMEFQKGAQWFSITHEFAVYLLSKEQWIQKCFSNTFGCDEMFLQSVLINSPYYKNIYQEGLTVGSPACMRKIDWTRGKPYIWQEKDYNELMTSECLFARKFDSTVNKEIINKIYKKLMGDK